MSDDLLARLESATGPDRELDAAIAVASGKYVREKRGRDRQEWFYSTERDYDRRCLYYGGTQRTLEAYTDSIDASLTLVPEGFYYTLGKSASDEFWCHVESGCEIWIGSAPTLALAICIAALRARRGV